MTLAGYENGHYGVTGFLAGARSRHMRTLVLAGVLLVLIWTIKKSPLFREHYSSGFTLINPDKVPIAAAAPPVPKPPTRPDPPVALPGDSFYTVDALHKALNPPPPPPPPPQRFPDSAAVIIETDPAAIPNLVPLMLHFADILGPHWPVVLVTQRANWIEPASPAFRRRMREQRVRIFFLPEPAASAGFASHESVSVFLTQPWLWEQFESADRVLLFQADSVICANSAARVEDFAAWDMVGAPIAAEHGVGVNGGLSLRNPRAMLVAIREAPKSFEAGLAGQRAKAALEAQMGGEAEAVPSWQKFEDQWFWHRLGEMSADKGDGDVVYKLPGVDVSRGFAVETVWEERPFGYHQPFRWLTDAQQKVALEWCPELAMLKGESHFF